MFVALNYFKKEQIMNTIQNNDNKLLVKFFWFEIWYRFNSW